MADTKKEVKIHRYEKYIAGVLIALLILIITNWPSISTSIYKEPEPFIIEGCKTNYIEPEIIDTIKRDYIGVPDYNAKLYLQPLKEKVLLNDYVEFTLEAVDDGIIRLNNSYFYILLYDPDGQLRTTFPCFCDGTPTNLEIMAYCYNSDGKRNCNIGSGDNPRFIAWPHVNNFVRDSIYLSCTNKEAVCVSNGCLLPQSLISGKINNRRILYRFKVDKLGEWKAFAFLYERQYKIREEYGTYSAPFNMNDILKRAIDFTETSFKVVNEKEETKQFRGFTFWQVFSIIIAFISYFSLANSWYGLYEPIRKFFTIHKKKILWLILLLLVVAIISWFFSRLACPLK